MGRQAGSEIQSNHKTNNQSRTPFSIQESAYSFCFQLLHCQITQAVLHGSCNRHEVQFVSLELPALALDNLYFFLSDKNRRLFHDNCSNLQSRVRHLLFGHVLCCIVCFDSR
ncbi:dolichol-phosphate mannosyltransferase subunit 3 [Platysternon megacephalum]|uniref:Dolichol-phosphate mannosyltransferase subunit 3 n=1 Tax=Platysternon megacephalum TaxID=55544 RepID=A0A4D9DNJ9_9SAUR|nr:dolichol-phosphate mannosyltransferase subunit 3 [Platysternon megacephalum]